MMNKIKTYWDSLSETIVLTKKEHCLLLTVAALLGCIIGMLVSPRRDICCGKGNGANHYYGTAGEDDMDTEE